MPASVPAPHDELDSAVLHSLLGGGHDLFSIGFGVGDDGEIHALCTCGWTSANWNSNQAQGCPRCTNLDGTMTDSCYCREESAASIPNRRVQP